jgi:hypothetical protein
MAQAVLAAATPQEAKNAVVELLVPEVRAALVS